MNYNEIYAESYFEHWLSMFSSNYSKCNDKNIAEMIGFYKQIEGVEKFINLKAKVEEISANNHLIDFLPTFKEYTKEDLERIVKLILES